MSQTPQTSITAVGIDIGKNSFHIVGQDDRGAIVLRQKWSRGQVEARFANMPYLAALVRRFCGPAKADNRRRGTRVTGVDAILRQRQTKLGLAVLPEP